MRNYFDSTAYSYDALGRSTSVQHRSKKSPVQTINYTYDTDVIDGTGQAIYKGFRTAREVLVGITSEKQEYAYDSHGRLVRTNYRNSHLDQFNYDDTGWFDDGGILVSELDYKSFGGELSATLTTATQHRYTGREFVETAANDSELYYYRARYYRPDLGRFITKDPLGMIDGTNQFIYVQNNPVIHRDPFGTYIYPPGRDPNNWPPSPPGGGEENRKFNCYAVCLGVSGSVGVDFMNDALNTYYEPAPCYSPCGCEDGVIAIYYSESKIGNNPYGYCHCARCQSNQWLHKLGEGPFVKTDTADGMASAYTERGWTISKIGCFKFKK